MNQNQKNNKIDVTVITPMYNVENLIGETVQCLKNNHCNLEILLIDDGSTDETVLKARSAVGDDHRFKILLKPNSGVSNTRNFGIEHAKGEYITFVDSDDILVEHAIDKLLSAAKEENADFVYGGIKRFNSTNIWTTSIHDESNLFSKGHKNILKNPELFFSMAPGSKMIHRNLLRNNIFPSSIQCAEDQIVLFNIFINAKNIYCIGEYIYYYRERDLTLNENSITQQKDTKAFKYLEDIIAVMQMISDKLKGNVHYDEKQKNEILKNYYERALKFDVWPLFLRVLKYHPHKTKNAFELVHHFMNNVDDDLFNYTTGFRYFFLRTLIDNADLIRVKDFPAYREFIRYIVGRLSDRTIAACSKSPNWQNKRLEDNLYLSSSSFPASFLYFLKLKMKKKIFRKLNKNAEERVKKYFLPFYRLFPVQKNKIVFASSTKGKMSANFSAILNELKKEKNFDYKIKKFLGLSGEFTRNLSRYFHLATAGTIILESYYRPLYGVKLNPKTKVLQIWHACGALKKFGFSALEKNDSNPVEFETAAHGFYTHIITSSYETGKCYAEAFGVPMDKIYPIGVPRTDIFFSDNKMDKIKREIISRYPTLAGKKNILYAPTFRGNPSERRKFTLPFDLAIIDELPPDYNIIIKLHPVVTIQSISVPDEYKDRIIFLPSSEDVNSWMVFADVLITDYSSLIFEYSFLDKPIVFYAPDLDSYFDERGFYFEYQEYTYGKIAQNEKELISCIIYSEEDYQAFQFKKAAFKEKFVSSCIGSSAHNIIRLIQE